uniref:Uncharacterized protein n=1 Tax=viral metagenome TaxID=1070528 RepID=A0A6H1Z9F8_9ZZZZ
MASTAPGYPTKTYYPYVGWFFYRAGVSAAYFKSRAHFAVSWGTFDPTSGTFPSVAIGGDGQIFLTMSLQM